MDQPLAIVLYSRLHTTRMYSAVVKKTKNINSILASCWVLWPVLCKQQKVAACEG